MPKQYTISTVFNLLLRTAAKITLCCDGIQTDRKVDGRTEDVSLVIEPLRVRNF